MGDQQTDSKSTDLVVLANQVKLLISDYRCRGLIVDSGPLRFDYDDSSDTAARPLSRWKMTRKTAADANDEYIDLESIFRSEMLLATHVDPLIDDA